MSHEPNAGKISFSDIAVATRAHYQLEARELSGRCKARRLVYARSCAVFLARRLTELSTPAIGNFLHRDHSTILTADRRAAALLKSNEKFRADVTAVFDRLKGEPELHRQRIRRAAAQLPVPAYLAATWV